MQADLSDNPVSDVPHSAHGEILMAHVVRKKEKGEEGGGGGAIEGVGVEGGMEEVGGWEETRKKEKGKEGVEEEWRKRE